MRVEVGRYWECPYMKGWRWPRLLLFSPSVVSDSLWARGLQHARIPCPLLFLALLKLMSTESIMPPNHFILCCPLLLLPSIFPSIGVFSSESAALSIGLQLQRTEVILSVILYFFVFFLLFSSPNFASSTLFGSVSVYSVQSLRHFRWSAIIKDKLFTDTKV